MGENNAITIDAVMDLANIQQLYDACHAAYQSGENEVKVDASKVERVKTPIYQLLLILKLSLEKNNRSLVIEGPTEAFLNMADCLGIKDKLVG